MKHLFITIVLFISTNTLLAQEKGIKHPSSFFPSKKIKVLVVGSFHFEYPNLDAVKVDDDEKIDILKEPKKTELTELVNYIKKFKPTKIAIEATDKWKTTNKLERYKKGEFKDKRDERYQIAMRIAKELNINDIYGIDASTLSETLEEKDSLYTQKLFKDFDFENDDKYNGYYREWAEYEKKMIPKTNLLTYFKHLNSREYHKMDYGAYLVGDFKLDNLRGPDILSIWWYNRNLRIFRNLQQIPATTEDRILVIFGNGHAAILRQLLESSPEYEFIEFDSLK
ncbi:DUF5694 domain-containing protein [Flavobacterium cerinum]|uniref:TraB/GumN family protein n=1 Tax=Flavobacterium cerinum TaxID=2502784 RepID=A0A3S3R1M5_9FLAO|nr:DUF5694 domain-containing protein [Flavobacterium cerinum]RWX02424.1 hypothetical protein EPI11_04170 [Flavobacterium cerinum]